MYNMYSGGFFDYDMMMNVTLLPPVSDPTPSQVKMNVNGTAVNDESYGGSWTSTTLYTTNSIFFDVTANWTISYDVWWQLNSTKRLYANTTYLVSGTNAYWNISFLTQMPSSFISTNATFRHPTDWTNPRVYNYSSSYTNFESTPSKLKVYWSSGSGNWTACFDGKNYLSSIQFTPSQTIRINDTVNITSTFRLDVSPNNISGTLEIYNYDNQTVNFTSSSWVRPGNKLEFFWTPSSTTSSNGRYFVHVIWNNGTEVGYLESYIDVLYNTSLTSLFDSSKQYILGENLSVIVHYKNEFNGENITSANVVGKWTYNSNIVFDDIGDGNYKAILNTSKALAGTYSLQVNASKTGYEFKTIEIPITLVHNTTISGFATYTTNYSISVAIAVNYTYQNNTGITGANVKILINGSEDIMFDNSNGTYTYTFSANTLGVFNCTMVATKAGHLSQTFTSWVYVYNLSTNLLAPNSYSVMYNEYLTVQANYTLVNGSGVSDANVSLFIGPYKYNMSYTGNGKYECTVLVNFTGFDSYTITAEKYGFSYQTITGQLTIIQRPTNISEYSPREIYAGSSLNISYTYLDNKTGDSIPNATWVLHFYGNVTKLDYSVYNLNNGTYVVSITNVTNPTSTNFTLYVEISLTTTGFELSRINATVIIMLKPLSISTSYKSEIDYGSNWSILVNYGVSDAQVIVNWSDYTCQEFKNGSYYIILNTTTINPSTQSVNITIRKENYVWYSSIITFNIKDIPTELIIIGNTQIAWGGVIEISISFYDTYHNEKLSNWAIQTNETITYSFNETEYVLIFNSTKFDVKNYSILVIANKSLYQTQQTYILVQVTPGIISANYEANIYYYVNETMLFVLTLNNDINGMPISGATVVCNVFDKQFNFTEVSEGRYAANITMPSKSGSYKGYIYVSALKYADKNFPVTFSVMNKYRTVLVLNILSQVEEGNTIVLNATLTYSNGTPIEDALIIFQVNVTFRNGTSMIYMLSDHTDEDGIAIVSFEVPENAEKLDVTATYNGDAATMATTKSTVVTVAPRMTLQTMLRQSAPILVIASMIIGAVVILRRKQKQRKVRKITELKVTQSIYDDLLNIRHLFVIHANFGVNLFYRAYGIEPLEPELISGFLTALSQFAQEVSDVGEEITEHKYQGMSILMIRYGLIRIAFISSKDLSDAFKAAASKVIANVSTQYNSLLESWTGNLKDAEIIGLEIEKRLAIPLFYVPLKVVSCEKIKNKKLKRLCVSIQDLERTTGYVTIKTIADTLGKDSIDSVLLLLKNGYLKEEIPNNKQNNNTPESNIEG